MIPYALIIILMNFTLASVAASGTSNNSLSTNSSSYARNQNINRFATSLNNNITSIFKTPQNLASALRDKRESAFELDPTEIARQNQITQQILTHYIERRLFPFSNVKQKVPSIAEILPKAITSTTSPRAISIATSPTYKRGLASSNNTRRKTYGQKLKNSTRRKYNTNKIETHDKEEQEIENRPSQERLTENFNEDEDATEQPASITYSNKYKNQDNHTFYYNNEWSGGRGFLLPYDIEDDVEHDVQEALQSVESEQYDQYYNNDIFQRDPKENEIDGGGDCPNCVDEVHYMNKWTMPLLKLGEKRYYLGIFFKANWFKATQYCRYHGMHLASISSQEENDRLEKYIRDYGLGHEHFWISGTDLADEGNFFWMSTGRPITFTNWNAGEPNNFRYENGEEENCLELWNRDGKGLKWNDSPCSFETYFVCEVQPN